MPASLSLSLPLPPSTLNPGASCTVVLCAPDLWYKRSLSPFPMPGTNSAYYLVQTQRTTSPCLVHTQRITYPKSGAKCLVRY
eukprot:1953772-Rhodomonas_salina.2